MAIPKSAWGKTFHAVSAHERRNRFRLELIDPKWGLEVWFPGVHSDIGGSYQDTDLSNITLYWMATHAIRLGVPLDVQHIPSNPVWWNAPGHDSYAGVHWWFGRATARDIPDNAIVHPSLALWEVYYANGKGKFDWQNAGFGENRYRDPIYWYLSEHETLTLDHSDGFLARHRGSGVHLLLKSFEELRLIRRKSAMSWPAQDFNELVG